MDSNRINKLAEGARVALMEDVKNNLDRVLLPQSDERLSEPSVVRELEDFVRNRGEDKAVEEIAYTWFNRLCALRFMDMRGYTPVGCVTSRPGGNLPAILADAREGAYSSALKMTEAQKGAVSAILNGSKPSSNPLGDAYVLLLLAACDSYRDAMGYLFSGDVQKRAAMRLLAPSDLLSEQSVLHRICEGMDAEACESVEVLGWLYQFYIAERKDEVLASKKKRSGVDEIGPATQLFTPNWIVRYLVDNSVGRLWMLNNPGSSIEEKMEFLVKPEGETEDFIKVYGPEDITVCDPACGSGHILVYAFDLLYEMYLEEGYRSDQIPQMILENNLFGMEIDDRAAEIASFALEMKAREKDPNFFDKCVDANITVLEPVAFGEGELKGAGRILQQHELLDAFEHMDEIGSLYVPAEDDLEVINEGIENLKDEGGIFAGHAIELLVKMRGMVDVLSRKYTTVVANPPYMGTSAMEPYSKNWIWDRYIEEKADLCTCFIKRGFSLAAISGYNSMVTMQSWMFLASYSSMRQKLLNSKTILSMAHLGTRAFDAISGDVVTTTATVFFSGQADILGKFFRLVDFDSAEGKKAALHEAIDSGRNSYPVNSKSYDAVPGHPIVYWMDSPSREAFSRGVFLDSIAEPRVGMATACNDIFMRVWYEVSSDRISFDSQSREEAIESKKKWFPFAKGGEQRRWYGNNSHVVNWENDGFEIRNFKDEKTGRIRSHNYNLEFIFSEAITWTVIGTDFTTFRYCPKGFLYSNSGYGMFVESQSTLLELLGFLNSPISIKFLNYLSPGMGFESGYLRKLPLWDKKCACDSEVRSLIQISKEDWDSFEVSWDFKKHPLVYRRESGLISAAYKEWETLCDERLDRLKEHERLVGRSFAEAYGFESDEGSLFDEAGLSVRTANYGREMRSLISYGVGCLFGRYSIFKDGLVLSNQGSTLDDFCALVGNVSFLPDDDNILPVLDEEWFEDDIVARFKEWLGDTYGKENIDENVSFIEKGLGRDLRSYFSKCFYADHCTCYSLKGDGKMPIYWLIQSPKKSFQALVYMHRMDKDTITKVLTDYVQPFRRKLDAQAQILRATGVNRDAAKADKYQAVIQEMIDWERDVLYPMSQKHIEIDLDDGVKKNYPLFKGAVAKVQGLL